MLLGYSPGDDTSGISQIWRNAAEIHVAVRRDTRQALCMASTTKLQKAGRAFLFRLVAAHGIAGAARMLRALADELEARG